MAELLMDEMIEGVDDKRLTDISKKLKLLQKWLAYLRQANEKLKYHSNI